MISVIVWYIMDEKSAQPEQSHIVTDAVWKISVRRIYNNNSSPLSDGELTAIERRLKIMKYAIIGAGGTGGPDSGGGWGDPGPSL